MFWCRTTPDRLSGIPTPSGAAAVGAVLHVDVESEALAQTNLYSSYVATKTPWRDGTTHLVMSPMEFMQRLTALVPRPRLHLPMTASRLSISAIGCPVWVGWVSSAL